MRKDNKMPDAQIVVQHLLQKGFVFEAANQKEFPLAINRSIGPNQSVNLLPTLKRIYQECEKAENRRASSLVSELTSLLVAADLGIAMEFLVELEVQKAFPRMMNQLRQDLKSAAIEAEENGEPC